MFEKKSVIAVEKTKAEEDALMSAALDAGADDMSDEGDSLGGAERARACTKPCWKR